jgi:hypothetical protein
MTKNPAGRLWAMVKRDRAWFRYAGLTIVFAAFVLLVIAGRASYSPFNYTLF